MARSSHLPRSWSLLDSYTLRAKRPQLESQLHSLSFWLHCRNSDKSLRALCLSFLICTMGTMGCPSHNAMSANPPGLYFLSSLSMPQAPGTTFLPSPGRAWA